MTSAENPRFKRLSSKHPILFALLVTLLMLLIYILAAILAQVFGHSTISFNLIEAAGRLTGVLIFVAIILRFRWQERTGLARSGSWQAWLLAAVVLVYEFVTYAYPYLADVDLAQANGPETLSAAVNALTTGPLEEFPFRGLVLTAFMLLWGGTKNGVWRAVLLSALIFGASHLIHILFGREIVRAVLLAINAGLGGIFYAAVVLCWRSVWPAVFLHSGLNCLATVIAFNVVGFSESTENLLVTIAFQIPLLIIASLIISQMEIRRAVSRIA